jgi:hypothetical protein
MKQRRTIGVTVFAVGLVASPVWAASHTTIQRAPGLRVTPPSQTSPAVQLGLPKLQAPSVINLKALTDKQIRALPDSAVVEFQGKPTTMGALRALQAKTRSIATVEIDAGGAKPKAKFAARRAQFLQQQQAALQAAHVKALAEAARLRQASATIQATQQDAIRNEAIQLQERAKTASPAEQARIE